MPGEQDVPKLTNDRHGHEDTEIDNAANPGAAGEAESSPGASPTTSTATTGIHFDHLGARMMGGAMRHPTSNGGNFLIKKFRCSMFDLEEPGNIKNDESHDDEIR